MLPRRSQLLVAAAATAVALLLGGAHGFGLLQPCASRVGASVAAARAQQGPNTGRSFFFKSSRSPCTRRLPAAGGGGGGDEAAEEVAIVVEASRSHALLPTSLASHGRLFRNTDNRPLTFVAPNEDVGIHIVAGTSKASGEAVVAFVRPDVVAKASKGSTVRVPASATVARPAGVGSEEACTLPYYAVSLLPALMRAGIHAGGDGAKEEGKKVCIVTGAGPDALFAIQILRAWECKVVACSRRDAEMLRKAGAHDVVDSSKESFSERYPSYAVVVDTCGTDVESIAANLERMKGAAYVSTMPSSIRRMQQKGLLQGAGIFGSVFAGKPEVAPTAAHWLPEKPGRECVEYVLRMGPNLRFPRQKPDMNDYMDGILWPKDAELNYRFGFPAPPPDEAAESGRGGRGGLDDADLLRKYAAGMRGGGEQDEGGQ